MKKETPDWFIDDWLTNRWLIELIELNYSWVIRDWSDSLRVDWEFIDWLDWSGVDW